jgi:hypothetical protein
MKRDGNKEFIDDLKNRFEWLKGERAKRENDWKEVQKFVAPSIFSWSDPADKTPKHPTRFTSRPSNYLKTLRSGITGYSVSPNIAWLKLGFEDPAHAETYGAKDWLEGIEKALYAEFNRSNLYPQVSKFIEFAASYGHAAMLIDEQLAENRLRFTTLGTQELYLDVNEYGEADAAFRHYAVTLRNAVGFFGKEKLSDARQKDMEDKRNWNNGVTILHAMYRREEFDRESKAAWDMPYASVYIDEAGDCLIDESGYGEFPFAVFIWDPVNGTAYGESPAIHALDDIRLLNIIDETRIKMAQIAAEPPYNIPDDMRGEVNVVSAGYNYYRDKDKIITPINTGQNYPITRRLRAASRTGFTLIFSSR